MAIKKSSANTPLKTETAAAKRGIARLYKPVAAAQADQPTQDDAIQIPGFRAHSDDADQIPGTVKKTFFERFTRSSPAIKAPLSGTTRQSPLKLLGKLRNPREEGRGSLPNTIPSEKASLLEPVPTVRPIDHAKGGWVSPSYMNARSVKLNPQHLSENRCVGYLHESPELEYYRMLRTHILQQTGGMGNTIMVTSAVPGEGKTLTAINLAFTFSREYKQTALLVDCDLRLQRIHQRLGYESDKGLVDYLIDDVPFSDLVVWPGVEKLTIISGGKTVKESSEMLGSLGMKNLVMEMKTRYPERYVIFDVPPLLTCADSLAFAPLVDYILVVVQAGKTSFNAVNRALNLLPGEKVLGLVMNRQHDLT